MIRFQVLRLSKGYSVKVPYDWRPTLIFSMIVIFTGCALSPSARMRESLRAGQSFFEKGQYSAAAAEYSRAVKIDPRSADAHFKLAECYMLLQQSDRAREEFRRTVDLEPGDFHARISMTNLLIMSGDLAEAKQQTDLLLKRRPADPAVHSAVASLLARQGNISGAIRETEKTITLAPGHWEPYLSLALLQQKDGEFTLAEASFKKVIELNPRVAQPHLALGKFYQSGNRFADAEQQFRSAMAIAPGDMAPREALAGLYLGQEKAKDAENVLLRANRDLPTNPDSLLALSDFYYSVGNMGKAVFEYAALYHERPNNLTVKKKYIQILVEAKRYGQAEKLNSQILNASPKDSDALVYRSEMQIRRGKIDQAASTLQTVIDNSPNHVRAHYAFGIAFQKQGHLERAESEFRKALNLNPDYLNAERALADIAMLKGDMDALEDAANQMIRLAPGSPEGYALRALANINRKRFDIAALDVSKAIAVAPQSAFGYVQLGNLQFARNQYGAAAKAFQDALDRKTDSLDALRGLMKTYVAEKQPERAIATAKAQIEKAPGNGDFYDLLGAGLLRFVKDPDGAEHAFEKSVALNGNTDAVIQLCHVLAENGNVELAISTAERALKKNPKRAAINLVLGDLYVSRLDWKEAETAYQNAVAISPHNAIAANDLARAILHTSGDLQSAMLLVQRARNAAPESPAIMDTLAWIYYQRGAYAMAVKCLKQALALKGEQQMAEAALIQYRLGLAYEQMKQPALAREHFERALQNDPNNREAAEIKAELSKLKS
jgi:tetratricopeptide (TPR) repeat protein